MCWSSKTTSQIRFFPSFSQMHFAYHSFYLRGGKGASLLTNNWLRCPSNYNDRWTYLISGSTPGVFWLYGHICARHTHSKGPKTHLNLFHKFNYENSDFENSCIIFVIFSKVRKFSKVFKKWKWQILVSDVII